MFPSDTALIVAAVNIITLLSSNSVWRWRNIRRNWTCQIFRSSNPLLKDLIQDQMEALGCSLSREGFCSITLSVVTYNSSAQESRRRFASPVKLSTPYHWNTWIEMQKLMNPQFHRSRYHWCQNPFMSKCLSSLCSGCQSIFLFLIVAARFKFAYSRHPTFVRQKLLSDCSRDLIRVSGKLVCSWYVQYSCHRRWTWPDCRIHDSLLSILCFFTFSRSFDIHLLSYSFVSCSSASTCGSSAMSRLFVQLVVDDRWSVIRQSSRGSVMCRFSCVTTYEKLIDAVFLITS